MSNQTKKKHYHTQSVDRALSILDALFESSGALGVSEIARNLNLHKSTVHRLLVVLTERGLVEQDENTLKYRLGAKLIVMGQAALNNIEISGYARPILKDLAHRSGLTAHLVLRCGQHAIYVDKVEDPNSLVTFSQVGKLAPMHCSGVGKVLLAGAREEEFEYFLETTELTAYSPNTITDAEELRRHIGEVSRAGYALDNEELEIGLKCIAAPIRDHTGNVIAALSISGMAARFLDEDIPRLAGIVMDSANKVSRCLGAR
jgi:IclR family KDG regulon transcriptional repressor